MELARHHGLSLIEAEVSLDVGRDQPWASLCQRVDEGTRFLEYKVRMRRIQDGELEMLEIPNEKLGNPSLHIDVGSRRKRF